MTKVNCILLSGFMAFDEVQTFLALYSGQDPLVGTKERIEHWATRYSYMSERLPSDDPYESASDLVVEVSESSRPIVDALEAKIRRYFPYRELPFDVKFVKIRDLVTLQYHINVERATKAEKRLRQSMTEGELIELCIDVNDRPDHSFVKQHQITDLQGGSALFTSDLEDFRFRGAECRNVYVNEEVREPLTDAKTRALLLTIGGGDPFAAAYRIQSAVPRPGGPPVSRQLVVLHDGLHRAYALHRAGYTHMPCVVSDLPPSAVSTYLSNWQGRLNYINLVRPPLVRDFCDSNLTTEVAVPARKTAVRFSWSVESFPIFS